MYYSDYNRPQENFAENAPGFTAQPAAPAKKKHAWPKVVALLLACALVGGGAGVGGAALMNHLNPPAQPAGTSSTTIYEGSGTPTIVNLSKIQGGQVLTPAEVYASNVNSVVGIVTQITTNGFGQQVAQAASGSGFVLTADGYIVTNHHVVEDATSISVTFIDGKSFDATVVGTEAENDLALLKIDATGLTPVRLGTSGDLVVGEEVVTIGNPLGELTYTMTGGMVSALDRVITMSDGTAINMLQTDCAINNGNSGGPLFNMYGQVIGITSAKYSRSATSNQASIEGIGFAIPIDDVKDMLTDIMEHGYVTGKPYVGVTLATANGTKAAQYGRSGGAYVQSIVPGAAADKAGLRQGDIITAVDGETIDGHAAFIEIKDSHKAGDTVTLTVDREGKSITLELTFDERKPDDQVGAVEVPQEEQDYGSYGYGDDDFGYNWPFNFGW